MGNPEAQRRAWSVFVCLWALAAFAACAEEPVLPEAATQPAARLVHASNCKSAATRQATPDMPSDRGCLRWNYYDRTRLLRLVHVNAGLNCCPEYTVSLTVEDGCLFVQEVETAGHCRCLCLYDFTFEIDDLPRGVYEVIVQENHLAGDDPPLVGIIDLTETESGSFCVPRGAYPWGRLDAAVLPEGPNEKEE